MAITHTTLTRSNRFSAGRSTVFFLCTANHCKISKLKLQFFGTVPEQFTDNKQLVPGPVLKPAVSKFTLRNPALEAHYPYLNPTQRQLHRKFTLTTPRLHKPLTAS
jgi:hypothetical protein